MYNWRKMTAAQREEVLRLRRQCHLPWHSPPHCESIRGAHHLIAACFEHSPFIGASSERMGEFAGELLKVLIENRCRIYAWCVLPNHYHVLIQTRAVSPVLHALGQLHGRTSHRWNRQENQRGRQVWCKTANRSMRSDRHHWATVNYIHHNPVRHGYVTRWQDWAFSSAADFLKEVGHDRAVALWNKYPLLDYGKGWDDL